MRKSRRAVAAYALLFYYILMVTSVNSITRTLAPRIGPHEHMVGIALMLLPE